MKAYIDKLIKREFTEIISLGAVVLIGFLAIGGGFFIVATNISGLKNQVASSTVILNQRIENLEAALATTTLTSQELAERLADQQDKADSIADDLDDISDTVGTLEKLSKTDRELLQKYSKVYFLSDNYVPMRLKDIDVEYVNDPTKTFEFHALALPYLENMFEAAKDDGVELKVVSAYRSFGTQSGLKAGYLVTYGYGANTFAADQGYSEHQLGTTLDITTLGQNVNLTVGFENTPAFTWLTDNAYKYGFILSYPKGNQYYQYEPWHWRFVGKSLATKLHRDGINFSDMDQRDIDAYLVKIFN